MPRVIHFEIPAEQLERAEKFYADVFGWTSQKWDGPQEYRLVTTGPAEQPGINGGITPRGDMWSHVINTIDVPSVDDYVEKIVASGGTIVMPKMEVPNVGYLAYFKDTEGNIFGIMGPLS